MAILNNHMTCYTDKYFLLFIAIYFDLTENRLDKHFNG